MIKSLARLYKVPPPFQFSKYFPVLLVIWILELAEMRFTLVKLASSSACEKLQMKI